MWLEDFIPNESWEKWTQSTEVLEKIKEASKKAALWGKRLQKDEKKAKKYDSILSWFLYQIVKNEKYDFLLNNLFDTLNSWFNSNFILWLLSLVYLPISDKIREESWKNKILFNYKKTFSILEFNDNLDEEIKNRINLWIEDIIDILILEYSSLQIKRILELNLNNEVLNLTSSIFIFFFSEININILEKKSISYSKFILSQIFEKIKSIEIEEI